MKVYVLCMSECDPDGGYWYEPTSVFATEDAAKAEGERIKATYLLPRNTDYIVEEFTVRE